MTITKSPLLLSIMAMFLPAAFALRASAEPAWTRTGNCMACHVDSYPGSIVVGGEDDIVDPDGAGPLPAHKLFRTQRGQTDKNLYAQLTGFVTGDTYAVALKGLTVPGVINNALLTYGADCGWSDWPSSSGHIYTDPTQHYNWGTDPNVFNYKIDISAQASYDYYELTFAVAGVRKATGLPFYAEEQFYLSVPPPNWPPTVSITNPTSSDPLYAPVDITINANAADSDGSITRVEFYQGATKLGETTTPPYALVWQGVAAGTYSLTAKAIDDAGAITTSTSVSITVKAMPGDMDADGDVDQTDLGKLQVCMTGSTIAQNNPACAAAKLDTDTDVDTVDMDLLTRCLSGADVRANPQCAG